MRRALVLAAAMLALARLGGAWPDVAAAQTALPGLRPLNPPPPDVSALIDFVETPADKPLVPIPEVARPELADQFPVLPPAPIVVPANKPTAPVPPPGALACELAVFGVAAASLDCGLKRYASNNLEEAASAFEAASRAGGGGEVGRRARYWLGETHWWAGRVERADQLFAQVVQEAGRDVILPYALHSSGWTALRLGNFERAREAFGRLATSAAWPLDVWGRHGLALALYGLGRPEQAAPIWADLAVRQVPQELARDLIFWHGESLGRTGQPARAVVELRNFVRGGAHPLLDTALLRQGWWALAAGNTTDSVAALRQARQRRPPAPRPGDERDWVDAGLALALLGTGDLAGARATARELTARQSALAVPVHLRLLAAALAVRRPVEAHAAVQELLGAPLEPRTRAWVLVASAEASRLEGNRDEARTQYQLARDFDPAGPLGHFAAFRLGQTNFELREFAQAAADVAGVTSDAMAPDLRTAALILHAEAAYFAGQQLAAERAYRRVLVEAPGAPQVPLVRLSLAWTALRRGQSDEARRHFVDFATVTPAHPAAADALVLAAELGLRGGDFTGARRLLDLVIAQHPSAPRTEFARLNLGILLARSGHAVAAQRTIAEWLTRAPFPPLVGRARATLGAAMLANGQGAEALREFGLARTEGVGALAALGLGAAALGLGQLDPAARDFTEARDTGTAAVTAAADYGLAAVAYHRGDAAGFRRTATAVVDAAPQGPLVPGLLYVLTGIAVQAGDWPQALGTARRLVSRFRDAEVADDALARVGTGAVAARSWPVASEALGVLRQHYPRSPFVEATRVAWAEAELENGRPEATRRELDAYVLGLPPGQQGRVYLLLARAREATGDRAGALEAYTSAARAGASDIPRAAVLSHARLLLEDRKWAEARGVAERALRAPDASTAAEAAQVMAQSYVGEGNHAAAAEYYMTAAYVAPASLSGRRGLLAAAQSFAALREPEAAVIAYRKLLAQNDVPADLAAAARQGLAALGRQP